MWFVVGLDCGLHGLSRGFCALVCGLTGLIFAVLCYAVWVCLCGIWCGLLLVGCFVVVCWLWIVNSVVLCTSWFVAGLVNCVLVTCYGWL